ncbi:hypothetical protein MRX96_009001 [Rhipicephalus microplus]
MSDQSSTFSSSPTIVDASSSVVGSLVSPQLRPPARWSGHFDGVWDGLGVCPGRLHDWATTKDPESDPSFGRVFSEWARLAVCDEVEAALEPDSSYTPELGKGVFRTFLEVLRHVFADSTAPDAVHGSGRE